MYVQPTDGPAIPAVAWDPALTTRIRAMRAEGSTLQGICDVLNAEGVPTARGAKLWRPSALCTALGYERTKPAWPSPKSRRRGGCWVYRLYGPKEHLIYIGVTIDIERRFRQHSQKIWWVNVRKSRLSYYATREAAERAERLAIAREKPRFNRSGKLTWAGSLSVA